MKQTNLGHRDFQYNGKSILQFYKTSAQGKALDKKRKKVKLCQDSLATIIVIWQELISKTRQQTITMHAEYNSCE